MSSVLAAERFGSGDGEREASMTRQMPYEPLPASVLFALGWLRVWYAVIVRDLMLDIWKVPSIAAWSRGEELSA